MQAPIESFLVRWLSGLGSAAFFAFLKCSLRIGCFLTNFCSLILDNSLMQVLRDLGSQLIEGALSEIFC